MNKIIEMNLPASLAFSKDNAYIRIIKNAAQEQNISILFFVMNVRCFKGSKTPKYLSTVMANKVVNDIKVGSAVLPLSESSQKHSADSLAFEHKRILNIGKLHKPTAKSGTDCIIIKKYEFFSFSWGHLNIVTIDNPFSIMVGRIRVTDTMNTLTLAKNTACDGTIIGNSVFPFKKGHTRTPEFRLSLNLFILSLFHFDF